MTCKEWYAYHYKYLPEPLNLLSRNYIAIIIEDIISYCTNCIIQSISWIIWHDSKEGTVIYWLRNHWFVSRNEALVESIATTYICDVRISVDLRSVYNVNNADLCKKTQCGHSRSMSMHKQQISTISCYTCTYTCIPHM